MRSKLTKALCIMAVAGHAHAEYVGVVGDVVGRDLAQKGAGWAGHTGIATAQYYLMKPDLVLQAMSEMPHIQEVTIDNFKSQSKYWGSRGGIIPFDYKYGRFIVANRVVQQYYACPDYSYTWQWKDGTITANNRPITCGLFRCDTIVNWAYAFGQYSLPTFDKVWTTPAGAYNSFPLNTDLLIPDPHNADTASQVKTNETIDWVSESNLKELSAELFYQLLQNTPDITSEQLHRLWQLFASHEVNSDVKVLFYNYLVPQDVANLTDDIIRQAKIEHGNVRHQLLLILQSIYQKKLGNNDTAGLEPIISYFNELQNEDLNKDDSGIVYRGIATLAPKDMRTGKKNMINMDTIHVDIFSIKSDGANELKYTKDIIYNLEHPDDSLLITGTYKYLTELMINSDLKFFSEESKVLLRGHLARRKIIDLTQTMLYTSAYVEFKAVLNAKNISEIPALTTVYMKSLDADRRETTPYGFSESTQKQLNIFHN